MENIIINNKRKKIQGSLIGGAIGDALGYTVEFKDYLSIIKQYGNKGITRYELINNKAIISDDTQMTLFTANGLLYAQTRGQLRGILGPYEDYIYMAYKDWFNTQLKIKKEHKPISWIYNIEDLHVTRAPGATCLNSLSKAQMGTFENKLNNSKGCGGVMRVAPVGLYFSPSILGINEICLLGAKTSAITHSHSLAHLSAYAMTAIINKIIYGSNTLEEAINYGISITIDNFKQNGEDKKYFLELMKKAIELSKANVEDIIAIEQLGEGWVAEETLAIAIYSCLKYPNDFEKAIVCSVNHSGDSDSTGSVTGNIIGAYLGYDKIPNHYLEKLELKEIIMEIADDLATFCPVNDYEDNDEIWINKYVYAKKK